MCVQAREQLGGGLSLSTMWVLKIELGSVLSEHAFSCWASSLAWIWRSYNDYPPGTNYYKIPSVTPLPTCPPCFTSPSSPVWKFPEVPRILLPRWALAAPLCSEKFLPNSHISIPPFSPTALSRNFPCDLRKIVVISMPLTRLSFTSCDQPSPRESQLPKSKSSSYLRSRIPTIYNSAFVWAGATVSLNECRTASIHLSESLLFFPPFN